MNPLLYLLIALRSSALALSVSGQPRTADRMYALADVIESGRATDAHMKLIAEKLKAREISDADWDDVMQRIETDAARLHSPG